MAQLRLGVYGFSDELMSPDSSNLRSPRPTLRISRLRSEAERRRLHARVGPP